MAAAVQRLKNQNFDRNKIRAHVLESVKFDRNQLLNHLDHLATKHHTPNWRRPDISDFLYSHNFQPEREVVRTLNEIKLTRI